MSTGMRITQRSIATAMLGGLQANLAELQTIQEQLSSGRQINRPSDSPVKTVEAMQFRSQVRRTEQYVRNGSDGLALLDTADRALTSSLELTRRVQELTLQGKNASVTAVGREAIAAEVDTLRQGLLAIANTRYLDRPVFGGTMAGTSAFEQVPPATAADRNPAVVYRGDDGTVDRTVGAGIRVEVTVKGTEVFGQTPADPAAVSTQLFDVLARISAALRGPEASVSDALDGELGALDTASNRIITTLGSLGARVNRVDTLRSQAEDSLVSLTNSLSEVESIDLPRTIVELQMQEVAYNAALGATARVIQPSLLDFLR